MFSFFFLTFNVFIYLGKFYKCNLTGDVTQVNKVLVCLCKKCNRNRLRMRNADMLSV